MSAEESEIKPGQHEGEWVTPEVSYVDPERRHCAHCGRPIARRYWRREVGGKARVFCGPDHAVRFMTYPKSSPEPGNARYADAPGGAGASRDGWSGLRTGSATGREGEPIDDGPIIARGDHRA